MAKIRKTRQRDAILGYLMTRRDHPCAEQVYEGVREAIPNISLGTVYRNLALLTDLGEIRTLYTGAGADRYDADIRPHNHFICNRCHSVIDMPDLDMAPLLESAARKCPGKLESGSAYFYGICEKCI